MKKALILFECSRTVADSFEDRGVEAWSMDIIKNDHPRHIQANVYDLNFILNTIMTEFTTVHFPVEIKKRETVSQKNWQKKWLING